MSENAKPSLSKEQIRDFDSGAISVLLDWMPRLIPGVQKAVQSMDGYVRINPAIFGGAGGWRLITSADYTALRSEVERCSVAQYGRRLRTDRQSIAEAVDLWASRNPVDGSAWFGELPKWDEQTRLKTVAAMLGFRSLRTDSEAENARIVHALGRVLMMQPCYHAQGIAAPVPLVLVLNDDPQLVYDLIAPLARGNLRTTATVARTEQAFAESFDPFASHLLLPGVPQILGTEYKADCLRFRNIVSQGAAYFRIPNMKQTRGVATLMPVMVGTVESVDWRTVARYVDVLPVMVDGGTAVSESEIAQCYAEAWRYANEGQPVIPAALNVKTDYRKGVRA